MDVSVTEELQEVKGTLRYKIFENADGAKSETYEGTAEDIVTLLKAQGRVKEGVK